MKLKTKPLSDEDRSDIKQPTQKKTEPFCIEITRNDFISFIKDVANNLNDQDYQSTADKHKYDF